MADTATTTGNANPSASVSTTTTGGQNINYQTNNQWNNESGFAPGVFCRSPTFYVGGGTAQNLGDTNDYTGAYSNSNSSAFTANIGVLIPFGSSVLEDCKALAKQIALDRKISSEISMVRACRSLELEGIKIDPIKFPLLAPCAKENNSTVQSTTPIAPPPRSQTIKSIPLKPISPPKS